MRTAGVIGGGPAGLIAAEVLARAGVRVTVYERMPSPTRKFLLAGHGGLNITHSEPRERMLPRYGRSADRLAPMLEVFSPDDLRAWCADLGEPTFVGSSGRVFPQSFRATPLVRAWLARLTELGVDVRRRHRWTGWAEDGTPLISGVDGATHPAEHDAVLFALGGASWPRLGADGGWVGPFADRGIEIAPLRPANVGLRVDWTDTFVDRFPGTPLKHVALTARGHDGPPSRGDAMLTRTGIEGGPVYALGVPVRDALDADGRCTLLVDLRPDLTADQLTERLRTRRPKDTRSSWLRRTLGLDPASLALMWEATAGALPDDPAATAALVKAVPVTITGTMPIDRAISTAGGITWSQVDEHLMLRALPGTFVAGEMLDWEAPTGGYLLQASFSTGVVAARGMLAWLGPDA
ncbi:NAD(P)/FAD-dependent oxidoreductase [Cellulomonas soli]